MDAIICLANEAKKVQVNKELVVAVFCASASRSIQVKIGY